MNVCAASLLVFAGLAGSCAAPSVHAAPLEWSGSAGVWSDKLVYGLSQTGGKPSAVFDLGIRVPGGWTAGAGLASLPAERGGAELSLGLGRGGSWSEQWAWQAGVTAYRTLGSGELRRPGYSQWGLNVAWAERLQLSTWFVPDQPGPAVAGARTRGHTWVVEAGWQQPLAHRLALDAGVGQVHYRGLPFAGYRYGSLGLSWGVGPLQLYASRVFSDSSATSAAGPRALLSLLCNF